MPNDWILGIVGIDNIQIFALSIPTNIHCL